jgi:hypothetical protein
MYRAGMFLLGCVLLFASSPLMAWGQQAHRVIGGLALDHLDQHARLELFRLLETADPEETVQWCNWPDEFRATDQGAWTAPMHFVNIPLGAAGYDTARDCGDGLCVTEAITRFAAELGDSDLPARQRREAFGFVCHFVGDLAQPLHAGFAFDRGGNDFEIFFNGQSSNLHRFWDTLLIETRSDDWNTLRKVLRLGQRIAPAKHWGEEQAVQWTNESHHLADTRAYPGDPAITQQFADESWQLVRRQLAVGGQNLATVLNEVLGRQQPPAR